MRKNDMLLTFAVLVIIFLVSFSIVLYLENQKTQSEMFDLKTEHQNEIENMESELRNVTKAKEKAELKAMGAESIADQISDGRRNSRIMDEDSCEDAGGKWDECPSTMDLTMPGSDAVQTICSPPGCVLPLI